MAWNTIEDFHKDMWMFSDIDLSKKNIDLEPPRTVQDWRNRMNCNMTKSIFDDDNEQSEPGVRYFISGRGRGGKNVEITPGSSTPISLSDDEEIRRKIRQVSGLGYSNEMIMEEFNFKRNGSNHSSPIREANTNGEVKEDKKPLPLSMMLKRGKEDRLKEIQNKTDVNIKCINEFPPL